MSLGADPRKLDYIRELPQNWKQKIQFLLMKNAVFCSRTRRYGRFFGHRWNLQNGCQKSPPKIHREMLNRMYFRHFREKRVANIGSHDGIVRWGLPSKMAQEHQKSDSSMVRWKLFSSSPSRLRSGYKRKIIHCSLNFGYDPATDKKRLILKGFSIEKESFYVSQASLILSQTSNDWFWWEEF